MLGDIFNLEKIIIVMRYIAPGILIVGTYSYFYHGRIDAKDILLKALITAALFQAVIFNPFEPIDALSQTGATAAKTALPPTFINLALYIVLPISIGLLTAITMRENWIGRALAWTGIQTIHPTPSAWDWKFQNTKEEQYLIVTLKDGTEWYGLFGAQSFVSSSIEERDIFLEKVYTISTEGSWIERKSSVLITESDIRSIEFFKA
ncbi:MAG: DUF6338 family protein [Hyphomicrobiales bacterium]